MDFRSDPPGPGASTRKNNGIGLTTVMLALNLAALCLLLYVAVPALRQPLLIDDAFMFHRYAVHLRQGLGISWNPDGVPTGGMTSMGWFLIVIPLSFFPLAQGHPLVMGSFLVGLAAIVAMAFAVSKLAISAPLKRFWILLPGLTLLLAASDPFKTNMVSGMDTMLSFALDAAVSCAIWAWCRSSGDDRRWPAFVGVLGACAVIVRPENGLLATLAPLLAAVLLLKNRRRLQIVWTALTFLSVMAVYLLAYHAYFHAFVPLSFYMKSQHPYQGYIGGWRWLPEKYLVNFALMIFPFVAFPFLCLNRRSARVAAVYLIPVALTFCYLQTVMQIMGIGARYYVPFAAPVLIAAFWMTDITLSEGNWRQPAARRLPAAAIGCILILLVSTLEGWRFDRWATSLVSVASYPLPTLVTPAHQPLPERPWFSVIQMLANHVIRPLPPGAVIAASEVGLIGASASQVAVIDLAGLNDNDIALHGFSMDRLLDHKPSLIWFPHSDYTWQRQVMFCAPRLLQEYTVIGGNAFNYSLAIRRNTPETDTILQNVDNAFQQLYPGASLQNYIVSTVESGAACGSAPR